MTDVLLATSSEWPSGEPAGDLLLKAFDDRGVDARWAVWDDAGVDWSAARLVAVRSTWDYSWRREEFLAWCEHVDRWSRMVGGPSVFRWNTDKSYLLDLARAGVPVVPTALLDDLAELDTAFAGPVVVKPRVGAGGRGLTVQDAVPGLGSLEVEPAGGPGAWLVQPLVESVRTEGEISVFVLGGVPVSQARKVPADGEIRVHEMYGGHTEAAAPTDEAMLLATETVAAAGQLLGTELAVARVDLVRLDGGRLVVGELEVTEPGLYLDVLPSNADAFAEVLTAMLGPEK